MSTKPSTQFDKGAARLCLIYASIGLIWVVCADRFRTAFKERYFSERLDRVDLLANIICALAVALILYYILKRYNRQIYLSKQKELETNRIAEKVFQENNRYYQAILENSFEGIVVVNHDRRLLYQSPSAEKLLGYFSAEKLDLDILSLLPEEEQLLAIKAFEELVSAPGRHIFSISRVMHYDGSERILEVFAKNLLDDPVVKGIVVNYRDVTEKNKAEERALNSMIEGEDRERRRIASELHDGLGQQLTAASLNFEGLKEDMNKLDDDKRQQFQQGLNFLNKAIDESRNIAHNLMPMSIEDFGLLFSLESLFSSVRKTSGLEVVFFHNIQKERFGKLIDINLYRITQEALNNVIKHAGAKQATVQLVRHPHSLIYTFEDDGIGFDNSKKGGSNFTGMGLHNIANRVKAMSGNLTIDSSPGKGATITIELQI